MTVDISDGIEWMDEHAGPDWQKVIDLDNLQMNDGRYCLVGQAGEAGLFGELTDWRDGVSNPYMAVTHKIGLSYEEATDYGFIAGRSADGPSYGDLEDAWHNYLENWLEQRGLLQ